MRIAVVSEDIIGYPDEGIRNWGKMVLRYWEKEDQVQGFSVGYRKNNGLIQLVVPIPSNRLFFSVSLWKGLSAFNPDLVFYISPSGAKFVTLFRAKVLKTFTPRAKVFIIALQPTSYNKLGRKLLPLLSPDGFFVQSARSMKLLEGLSCPVCFMPSGVDTIRFEPSTKERKEKLREKYKIDKEAFVILHVGHINRKRNIQLLRNILLLEKVQVILVGSTSTPQDEGLIHNLSQAGVLIIREYFPNIEELYQLADVYLFPVISETAAIGVPLSVLEAMACNLSVITTRFGGLPLMFQRGDGFFYYDREDELPELILKVRKLQSCATRKMVEPYDWKNVAEMLLRKAMAVEKKP